MAAIASALLLAGALAAGCGTAPDSAATGPLTVYVSVPLRGANAEHGRDIRDGAELALADAEGMAGDVEVELDVLDDTDGPAQRARWSAPAVARNARVAAQDTSAVAYIGDLESGATRVSLPITNEAMLPQVSPASTAVDLVAPADGGTEVPEQVQPSGVRTFLRVIPDDGAQAEAGAGWTRELRARRVAAVGDRSAFGELMVEEFEEEAAGLGIEVTELDPPVDVDLVYVAATAAGAANLKLPATVRRALTTDALLLAPDDRAVADGLAPEVLATAATQDPEQLPAAGQDFVAAFEDEHGRAPGPYAAYGYEAMALVLDAIERAGDQAEDRRAVLEELLATRDRESVLGTYSITAVGNTTLDALAGYRVESGGPVFERALRVP